MAKLMRVISRSESSSHAGTWAGDIWLSSVTRAKKLQLEAQEHIVKMAREAAMSEQKEMNARVASVPDRNALLGEREIRRVSEQLTQTPVGACFHLMLTAPHLE